MRKYQAIAIDYHNMYVMCPNHYCKHHIHHYPSNRNIYNRNEIIKSKCKVDDFNNVCIRIDETTYRTTLNYYPNKSITISKRKFIKEQREYEPNKVPSGKIKIRHGNFIVKFK
jgi:hypothetical protein